jgi:hypothetical protein
VYAAYEERVDGAPRALTAVNVPAAESDLTAADSRELLLGVGRAEESGERAAAPATPIEVEGRQRLWRALLLVALAALALEAVWGARGWRGHSRRANIETSGGSAG